MIEHVRRRTLLCNGFSEVVVATCDDEVAATVKRYDGKVIMTSKSHQAASDRVAEALNQLHCTHVVNVQGDEILVLPSDLAKMMQAIHEEPTGSAWNALGKINDSLELKDPSIVKCVVSRSCRVLFCTRDFSLLPLRGDSCEPVRIVLGILAYSSPFLETFQKLSRTPLEIAEAIDQSRVIEHDFILRGVEFSKGYPGINEPREVPLVERYLSEDPQQREVLSQIQG